MKITIKSIKQVAYIIDVPSEEIKVIELKSIIENTHNFDKTALKLLFNGTLLDDSKCLKDYNIKEGMSIIMMNVKAKAMNVNQINQVNTKVSNEEKKESNEKLSQSTQPKLENKVVEKPKPQEKDYQNEVKQLIEMGFSAEESKNAIKAAKGNVTIAIEFLYNGIPNSNDYENQNDDIVYDGENLESDSSAVIKNIATMVKIASQNDPSQVPNIILQLQQTNPELFDLISENEEEFRNLLSQPITQEEISNFQRFNQQSGGLEDSEPNNNDGNSESIKLSKPDFDAVQRLKALGFSEMDAVQAYFAFEKNEEMAANFLYESKFSEDDLGGNQNINNNNQKK